MSSSKEIEGIGLELLPHLQ